MTQKQGDFIRSRLIEFLPEALEKVLETYHKYADDEGKSPKDYKEQQNVCKMALGHIELLLKLKEQIDQYTPQNLDSRRLRELVEEARAELGAQGSDINR